MDCDVAKDIYWIEDASGRRYRLLFHEESSFWFLKVNDGNILVAIANCQTTDTALTLLDLRIFDQVHSPELGLLGWLRGILNWNKKPVNYRKRGLGSALLRFIVFEASRRGLVEINGRLSQHDLKPNPSLADWYRRHGFEVSAGGIYGAGRIRSGLRPVGH